jgi:hypothetical protein
MSGLIGHLEKYLGRIDVGWQEPDSFRVLRFKHGPIANAVAFSTLGLSNSPLASPTTGKSVRHELLFINRADRGDMNIPAVLRQVGMESLSKKRPVLRGDVIGPRGQLFNGSTMEALYVAIPVYLPDSFHTYTSQNYSVVFPWLVPITRQEALYVAQNGWNAFEDRLSETDPDLLDIQRPSIVPKQ